MPEIAHNPTPASPRATPAWVRWACGLLVVATLVLIALGGTVTSKGVGLSVPDWPTTYNHNMFLFPPSQWRGGIFWEHLHRLKGAAVGLITIAVAAGLWVSQRNRPWLRLLGVGLLALVIVQGVMGGLRVTQLSVAWAILHGVTAQVFFCLTVLTAAAVGTTWARLGGGPADRAGARPVATLSLLVLAVLLGQLVLGAWMRHTEAGLAIPDFPTAYGGWLPPLSDETIQAASLATIPYEEFRGYATPAQVAVHFAHRVWAVVVTATVLVLVFRVGRLARGEALLVRPTLALLFLLAVQVLLGASVIWSGRHPEVATAHQATGAVLLATATLLAVRLHVLAGRARGPIEINHPRPQSRPGLEGATA